MKKVLQVMIVAIIAFNLIAMPVPDSFADNPMGAVTTKFFNPMYMNSPSIIKYFDKVFDMESGLSGKMIVSADNKAMLAVYKLNSGKCDWYKWDGTQWVYQYSFNNIVPGFEEPTTLNTYKYATWDEYTMHVVDTGNGDVVTPTNTLAVALAGPASGVINTAYTYTATITGGTIPYTLAWSADGFVSQNEATANYKWATSGTKKVEVYVTDSLGQTGSASLSVTIVDNYTLTVNINPPGAGSVTPSGGSYTSGTVVTLTETPIASYKFVNWSGDATGSGSSTAVTMNSNKNVTANFAINTYTLTYTAGPGGTISGTTSQTVSYGGSGTAVTAVPNTGYYFVNWSDGKTANPRTDTNVTVNIFVTATFAINYYTVTFKDWNGTVLKTQSVAYGGSATPPANPARTGYTFAGWSGSYTNVTSDRTITATYTINTYTITASAGTGGSISPSGTIVVNYGSSKAFTITASTGYNISSVTVDGSSVGAVSSYTFSNVTSNHTINATFAINTYTITASAGTGGSISPSGSIVVNYGSSKSFSITPSTGYHIASVVVDGSNKGAISSYTFTNVTSNHTINAAFAINTYTYTVTFKDWNGTVLKTQSVAYGGSATPPANPARTGYVFSGWSGSYTNVTSDRTITATYTTNTFTITASAGTGGSISPSGTIVVNYGSSKAFTITASTGYNISSVTVDGSSVGAVSSYTFSNVTSNHTISASFTASLIVSLTGPTTNLCVNANGTFTATVFGGTSPYTYSWTGGGIPSTGSSSSLTTKWSSTGWKTVSVTVTDSASHTATVSYTVNVTQVSVSISGPTTGNTNTNYTYTATPSGGTSPYTYSWSGGGSPSTGTGSTFTTKWSSTGSKTVSVTATDADGCSGSTSTSVSISSTSLIISISGPSTLCFNDIGTFTASVSGGTAPYTYSWSSDGRISSTGNTAKYRWRSVGWKTVSVTVIDSASHTATVSFSVIVIRVSVSISGPTTGTVNTGYTFTTTASGGTPPYTWTWSVKPVPERPGQEVPQWIDVIGPVTDDGNNPTDIVTLTYNFHSVGRYQVNASVTDANGCSGGASMSITIQN